MVWVRRTPKDHLANDDIRKWIQLEEMKSDETYLQMHYEFLSSSNRHIKWENLTRKARAHPFLYLFQMRGSNHKAGNAFLIVFFLK